MFWTDPEFYPQLSSDRAELHHIQVVCWVPCRPYECVTLVIQCALLDPEGIHPSRRGVLVQSGRRSWRQSWRRGSVPTPSRHSFSTPWPSTCAPGCSFGGSERNWTASFVALNALPEMLMVFNYVECEDSFPDRSGTAQSSECTRESEVTCRTPPRDAGALHGVRYSPPPKQ